MVNTQHIQRNYLRKPEQHIVAELEMKEQREREKDEEIIQFEKQRSILDLDSRFPKRENIPKHLLGLFLYVTIFILLVPYLMYTQRFRDEYILAYVANVDMLATVFGYNGGPGFGIWKYLYNPNNVSLFGFFNTTLINYAALLGATFMVATMTHQKNSWYYGWSGAFVFLLFTYLLPGNFIVIFQNQVEQYLYDNYNIDETFGLVRYLIVVAAGLVLCISIILVEALVIRGLRPHIISMLKHIHRKIGYY